MDKVTPRILQKAHIENELEKLMGVETEIKSDSYLLSFYFPLENLNRSDAERHVKSFVLEKLRSDEKLGGIGKLHQSITEAILGEVANTGELGNGLAGFMNFTVGENFKDLKTTDTVRVFPLSRKPEKEFYLGNTFDLDQLIWLINSTTEAIVITLTRDGAGLYSLEGDKLYPIKELENEFIKEKEQEHLEEYTPSPSMGSIYHGNASEKMERSKGEENRRFAQQLVDTLKDDQVPRDADLLIMFYSSSFSELIEKFEKEIKLKVPRSHPIFIQKNLTQEKQLIAESKRIFEENIKKLRKQSLDKARENYDRYVEGWNEVSKAANDRRIDTLYINPVVRKRGYVLDRELVYTRAVKDSREVRNIGPWIVRNVVESDGKIVIMNEELLENEIAARLRY